MPKPSAELKSQAEWAAAIGEPTRILIIRLLAAGDQPVSGIAREIDTETSNLAHHLQVLKDAGIVSAQKDGRYVFHSLIGATVSDGVLELAHTSGIKFLVPLE